MVSNTTDQDREQRIEELRQALTVRQLKFADGVLDGLPQVQAYRAAYPTCKRSVDAAASRLLKHVKVREYVSAVRAQRAMADAQERAREVSDRVLTRQRKREILREISENEDHPANSRISAVSVDNAMTGDNEPVRVEFTLSGIVNALRGTTDLPAGEKGKIEDDSVDLLPANAKVCDEDAKVCKGSNNGNGQNGNSGNGGHS